MYVLRLMGHGQFFLLLTSVIFTEQSGTVVVSALNKLHEHVVYDIIYGELDVMIKMY